MRKLGEEPMKPCISQSKIDEGLDDDLIETVSLGQCIDSDAWERAG